MGAGGGAGGEPRDEFGRMPVGEETQALVEQLGKHRALVVGDDPVADMREQHSLAVSREAFGGKQRGRDGAENNHAGEIVIDVSLVDDVADEIGA